MAIMILSIVSASTVTIVPASGATLTGTKVLNGSLVGYTFLPSVTFVNVSWYAKSASTANSSWVLLNASQAVDLSVTNFTGTTFNSLVLEDSNDYIFNITYSNTTVFFGDAVSTGVIVQNSVPIAPLSITPTSDDDGAFTISSTVAGLNTTGCTLTFDGANPGSGSYAMTHSGNTCTQAFTGVPDLIYKFRITASDGTDTANSVLSTLTVTKQTSAGKIATYYNEGLVDSSGNIIKENPVKSMLGKDIGGFPVWLIVVIVIAGIVFAIKRK